LALSADTEQMHISSDNAVYIHTNCQTIGNRKTITFTTEGQVQAATFKASSDLRLKENLQPYTVTKDILSLPIYKFDFINGSKNNIGCMAQDLQLICPEIVHYGDDGYLNIEESKIVYLLLAKMKDMQAELHSLREEVKSNGNH
jgi:hypothetical protein